MARYEVQLSLTIHPASRAAFFQQPGTLFIRLSSFDGKSAAPNPCPSATFSRLKLHSLLNSEWLPIHNLPDVSHEFVASTHESEFKGRKKQQSSSGQTIKTCVVTQHQNRDSATTQARRMLHLHLSTFSWLPSHLVRSFRPPPAASRVNYVMERLRIRIKTGMVDFLVALAATTTCDETHENPGMATVTRDRAETVELSLVVVDSVSSQAVHWLQLFVRPAFTAFSPFSVRMTGSVTNDSIVGARHTLASAITEIDNLVQAYFSVRNRTFAFVTHGDHLLRFHLPREAKEKGVALPLYFSSFFDIAQEAKLWAQSLGLNQVVNPRVSLVALCHLVGLQHEGSTYRGIDNAVMISKLTIRLLATNNANATISTVDDVPPGVAAPTTAALRHHRIFSTPYNLATRLAEFYENESKFIYVTGLPFAASVNDIQSWLRQGNLVAAQLWMVKNQEGRPDGSGYIVFASHSDAHSAIVNLNGRAIDGRAIQTAPASETEFELMRSLRSPFPTVQEVTSTNTPAPASKPGDWMCATCQFHNFASRILCKNCNNPNKNPPQPSPFTGSLNMSPYHYHTPHQAQTTPRAPTIKPGDWFCPTPTCRFQNYQSRMECFKCRTQRPPPSASTAVVGLKPGDWVCGSCHKHNFASRSVCMQCGAASGSAVEVQRGIPGKRPTDRLGDWTCASSVCRYHNYASRVECFRCGGPKKA